MRSRSPWIALLLVYLMTPGAGEVTENAVHYLTTGHTAHAIDDVDHHPTNDEHGCSGPFHVCQCHATLGFLVDHAAIHVDAASPGLGFAPSIVLDAAPEGTVRDIFRPPTI